HRALPFQFADDRQDVAHIGVERIVLARAPAGFAEAALVEARDLAVGRERLRHGDPVEGIEIIGAVHEQDGRAPRRPEGAVEDRHVAGIHPSVALHGTSPRLAPVGCGLWDKHSTGAAMARATSLTLRCGVAVARSGCEYGGESRRFGTFA